MRQWRGSSGGDRGVRGVGSVDRRHRRVCRSDRNGASSVDLHVFVRGEVSRAWEQLGFEVVGVR